MTTTPETAKYTVTRDGDEIHLTFPILTENGQPVDVSEELDVVLDIASATGLWQALRRFCEGDAAAWRSPNG